MGELIRIDLAQHIPAITSAQRRKGRLVLAGQAVRAGRPLDGLLKEAAKRRAG